MIYSYAAAGFSGQLIHVECSIRRGMPNTDIVGLPDGAVREARERVRAVLHHCDFFYPGDRILINLAPAGFKKSGAGFDLPIALSILLQSCQLPVNLEDLPSLLVLGELELSGRVRSIDGVLAAVASAYEMGIEDFLVPAPNLKEALSIGLGRVFSLEHITELSERIRTIVGMPPEKSPENPSGNPGHGEDRSEFAPHIGFSEDGTDGTKDEPGNGRKGEPSSEQQSYYNDNDLDFSDIKGQPLLKRAVEIAIVGRHNMLIFGPPGCGKTMVVRSLPSLLPALRSSESVETTRIWSQAGLFNNQQSCLQHPPLRMPHHSASLEGLVGGGPQLSPGEVSLAHNGVLFLDEAPEFKASHLQGLREPMESQRIVIVRAGKSFWYPADFQLFMAINPCPCGNLGREESVCTCTMTAIAKYWKRVGGALLDRIDMRIPVSPTSAETLLESEEQSSEQVRTRIARARGLQQERFAATKHKPYNSRIPAGLVAQFCPIDKSSREIFHLAVRKLGLSSRACHSVLRIARSIADLEQKESISQESLLEAIEYRRYGDRNIFWTSF
ncbi:YifB family Mg chelatase-like AAA ATPase [Candidatus Haliotispira prima]|uniref:YifB family Mg chelatase-like AAA ATPase n=1 Tax=Candidatus Haliotispira prima TaxID=3034016 RepID=A0ABY8ME83_9SPIO|nr:YifB family Mg chelatase-like AAA ATPase [Candidatus Haliotispira prima]